MHPSGFCKLNVSSEHPEHIENIYKESVDVEEKLISSEQQRKNQHDVHLQPALPLINAFIHDNDHSESVCISERLAITEEQQKNQYDVHPCESIAVPKQTAGVEQHQLQDDLQVVMTMQSTIPVDSYTTTRV